MMSNILKKQTNVFLIKIVYNKSKGQLENNKVYQDTL